MSASVPKPPEILDKIVDIVLAHKPKPKTKVAKKRKQASAASISRKGASRRRRPLTRQ